jgi:hypothetical protein
MSRNARCATCPWTAPPRGVRRAAVASRLCTLLACCSMVLLAGCRGASSPENVAGVRAMYRSIGIDASSSDFGDICDSYMDEQLRSELKPLSRSCFTSRFEHWAEKIRLSKVTSGTRIVVSGREALVYDGARPEKAVYVNGQWRLGEVPDLTAAGGLPGR